MKRKLLLSGEGNSVKDIAIFDDPRRLKAVLNKMSWEILKLIGDGEMYPMEIAKKLGAHEQKVYYHIRELAKAGVLEIAREESRKGATAKYYRISYPSFGVELPYGGRKIRAISTPIGDEKMRRFLYPFIKDGVFDGKIVVGSPDPHGPFKSRARDGHYASYLTLFFGQLVELPEDFAIKLDVDVKAEKEEGNNLIVIGGPGTNLITQEVNDFLPIKFNMVPSKHGYVLGGLVSEKTGAVHTSDSIGIIAKITNPWNQKKQIMILAGNKAVGTKACVLALAKFWKKALKNFNGQEKFAALIQGFDLDGDGKVDSVEVLE